MAKVKCPKITCRSTNCIPITENHKYKKGKGLLGAAIGGALLGPAGALIGAGSGLNGKHKVKFMCQDCGNIFEVKM